VDLGLTGKVALVTGSSRGLGLAVADELAAEGCDVVLSARSADVLSKEAARIERETGRPTLAVPADLSSSNGVQGLLRTVLANFSHVDVLVTNAGGPPVGTFEDHSPDAWNDAVRLTLRSVLDLTRGVLPGMKERGWGRIVNITSIAVKQPVNGLILSNSVRAAVTGFAKTLASEVAPLGITVNNALPGYTWTQRVRELAATAAEDRGVTSEEVIAGWEATIPVGRLAEPREFAALVAFLASERASYVTGASVAVDGGCVKSLL
jgi:3-oxoacyl-[acyl-carrier protein] reductase